MVRSVVARLGIVVGWLAAGLFGGPAWAQDDCAPIIRALAETVLAGRDGLPPLQARRFGTRAIYLLSRYGDLADDEIEALLAEAVAARMHGAADLEMAWRLYRDTPQLSSEALAAMVDTANPSTVRALLMTGRADLVMAAIAALSEGERAQLSQLVVTASFDQPDAVKVDLGSVAAREGLDWLAAGLAASQQDPAAWAAQIEGLNVEEADNLITLWGWMPGFVGNPILARSTAPQDAEARAWREASRLVAWAAATQPEFSLISTFLNQTGARAESAAVAKAVLKRFRAGALSATGPLDGGWLATLEAFDAAGFDADDIGDQFGSLTYGINRTGRDDVGDVLDWIVAVDALAPYLRGEGDLPTDMPALLSSEFTGWAHWLALAHDLHDDAASAISEPNIEDLPILAELLLAAGKRQQLAQMLQAQPTSPQSVALADDFAARIDRLCDAHLWHKGEAPLLAGQAMYKFDAAED